MRITNLMMANQIIQNIEQNQDRINTLQEQIASTKQFQNPSDDPINSSMSLQLKSTLSVSEGYRKTAEMVKDWMTTTDTSLDQLETLANRASSLVLSGLNGTMDDSTRASSLATELTEMINQAVEIGNTKYQGSYIFSGVKVNDPAFILSDASTLEYKGGSKSMLRSIGQSSKVTLNINGDEAIQPLIQAMIKARDNLANNNLSELAHSISEIKAATENLDTYRTANGTRMRQVESSISYLVKSDTGIQAILSEKEDTNMAEAYTLLQGYQNTYQAVLEVSSRTISALDLFDYLQ